MRVWALTVMAAAAFSAVRPATAAEWFRKFDQPPPANVRLDSVACDVSLRGGDVTWIEARVTTVGWSIGAGGVEVLQRQTGDLLDLGVRSPREYFGIGTRSVRIDLVVPRKLNAIVRTGEGAIAVSGFSGIVRLNTGTGRLDAIQMDGSLDAHTGDGNLHATGRFDRLNLRTNDGAIDVQVEAGSKIKTAWRVENGSGAIDLLLPAAFPCNLDARTGEGEVTVDLPDAHGTGSAAVRAKIGGGGPNLVVRTRGGPIHIHPTPQ